MRRALRRSSGPAALLDEAEAFIRAFCAENPAAGPPGPRIKEVQDQVIAGGTYAHTQEELRWAARVAWRHAGRCSGRDKWRTLKLRDRRHVSEPQEVFDETMAHLREVSERGRVRSMITVFAPDAPGRPGPRIISGQVLRYAGYQLPGGGILGDPANAALTELAQSLGWQGAGSRFDLLPLIVRSGDGRLHAFDIPADAVLEVPISHPDHDWLGGLGLKWYAVPLICDMYLDAGGIRYPCAPFNGWYQASTEIGVRNLGDEDRYDMLPEVAKGMGLDTSRLDTFWRDRAAVELAAAVHASFREAGVMVTDHQTEARRFMKFAEAEEAAGRPWCADWAWVNPPISASTCPSFHRTYPNPELKPGFFRHQGQLPLTALRHRGPPPGRLVIDMRWNGGGDEPEAAAPADQLRLCGADG